jgi:hypothetical protein
MEPLVERRGRCPLNSLQVEPSIESPNGSRLVEAGSEIGSRRLEPQASVGPVVVVVLPPRFEDHLRLSESGKPMLRETLSNFSC